MLEVDRQCGGFTPWNEICPKKYLSPGIPVDPLWQNSCNLSCAIPLGVTPRNLYPACNIDKNGHIEVENFNLLKPDLTIPLGFCHYRKRFSKSSTNAVFVELFYGYSVE